MKGGGLKKTALLQPADAVACDKHGPCMSPLFTIDGEIDVVPLFGSTSECERCVCVCMTNMCLSIFSS